MWLGCVALELVRLGSVVRLVVALLPHQAHGLQVTHAHGLQVTLALPFGPEGHMPRKTVPNPRKANEPSMKARTVPWNANAFHGTQTRSMERTDRSMERKRVPWNANAIKRGVRSMGVFDQRVGHPPPSAEV